MWLILILGAILLLNLNVVLVQSEFFLLLFVLLYVFDPAKHRKEKSGKLALVIFADNEIGNLNP